MKILAAAFFSALVFGLGLGISGMTLPSKVIGFLDVAGNWDPSLMAVMVGAILVHSISYQLITKRKSPLLVEKFQIPNRRDIDWKLILGSVAFGAGWGIGGFCPGPALVGLMSGNSSVLIFVFSMVIGIYAHNFFNNRILNRKVS
jgi:uncharacterized membrane protein YedE/YeeE